MNTQRELLGSSRYNFVEALIGYSAVIFAILECRSVYSSAYHNPIDFMPFVCVSFVILFLYEWMRTEITKSNLLYIVVISITVIILVSLPIIINRNSNGPLLIVIEAVVTFILSLGIFSFKGMISKFCNWFSNAVCLLAVVSLVMWLLCSVLRILPFTNSFLSVWAVFEDSSIQYRVFPSFLNIYFETQTVQVGSLELIRNTAIFSEAPMYSFILCLAMLAELFAQSTKPSGFRIAVYVISIISSISTSGIVFIVIIFIYYINVAYKRADRRQKVAILFCIVCSIIFGSVLIVFFVFTKLKSESGVIRFDDISACIKAWSNNVLFGNGVNSDQAIISYLSADRAYLTGISSTLFRMLAQGGILLSLYPICLVMRYVAYGIKRNTKYLLIAISLLWLLVNTSVTYVACTWIVYAMLTSYALFTKRVE